MGDSDARDCVKINLSRGHEANVISGFMRIPLFGEMR